VTREKKLREVLNVRLDAPLARELRRIAASRGKSESEVARWLLGYGIEVSRRLEAQEMSQPYAWEIDPEHDAESNVPHMVEIEARTRPMTPEEIAARGMWDWIEDEDEHEA
jgi:hypothetical protein